MAAHQQLSLLWWEKRLGDFDVFVSQIVLDEAGEGDPGAAQQRLDLLRPFNLRKAVGTAKYANDAKTERIREEDWFTQRENGFLCSTLFPFAYLAFLAV